MRVWFRLILCVVSSHLLWFPWWANKDCRVEVHMMIFVFHSQSTRVLKVHICSVGRVWPINHTRVHVNTIWVSGRYGTRLIRCWMLINHLEYDCNLNCMTPLILFCCLNIFEIPFEFCKLAACFSPTFCFPLRQRWKPWWRWSAGVNVEPRLGG